MLCCVKRVRSDDEWFDEPDELDRVEAALQSIDDFDVLVAAVQSTFHRREQREPLYCWPGGRSTTTDYTGAGSSIRVREIADLLVQAAARLNVEAEILRFFADRA